jgi:hypothetical protein
VTQGGSATRKGPKKSHLKRNLVIIGVVLLSFVIVIGFLDTFVFYEYTGITPSAMLGATSTQCFVTNSTCSFIIFNSGSLAGTITGCSFSGSDGGQGVMGGKGTVQPGSQGRLFCTAPSGLVPIRGATVTGSFAMRNAPTIPFAAIWE